MNANRYEVFYECLEMFRPATHNMNARRIRGHTYLTHGPIESAWTVTPDTELLRCANDAAATVETYRRVSDVAGVDLCLATRTLVARRAAAEVGTIRVDTLTSVRADPFLSRCGFAALIQVDITIDT